MNRPFSDYNAEPVLERLEKMIEAGWSRRIDVVYDDLSIFDWWPEKLTVSHMKQMRTFLKEAIKLGYTGYVCFKVGTHCCANGMWAHKEETKNGYSPDGDFIYRSFTPDYTNWQAKINGQNYPEATGAEWDSCKTAKQLETILASL
ncbi:MAG: hypothetical protein IKP50_05200 [Bacilli bacterium]|nr:hypothetical protein [Bacilli bacterium]